LKLLLCQSASSVDPLQIVEYLLLRRAAANIQAAEIIVNVLPLNSIVAVADKIATLWGEKVFISRGDQSTQQYLTAGLLAALRRLNSTDLSLMGPSGVPLAVLLSSGISAYLDQTGNTTRLNGMRVAKQFALMMGRDIVFDELVEEERREASRAAAAMSSDKNLIANESRYMAPPMPAGGDFDVDNGENSDSDSELEGFDLGDDDITLKDAKQYNYLRVCLESKCHAAYPCFTSVLYNATCSNVTFWFLI
jgi:hypothetical protein